MNNENSLADANQTILALHMELSRRAEAYDKMVCERDDARQAIRSILAITDGSQPKDFGSVPWICQSALGLPIQ